MLMVNKCTRHICPSLFWPKFWVIPIGVDPWCCGPCIPKTLG